MGSEHRTSAYQRERAVRIAQARTHGEPCSLAHLYPDTCPVEIDYTLTYPDPWSVTAEHGKAVRHGGTHTDITGVAHLNCQQRQGGEARAGHDDEWDNLPPIRRSGVW